VAAHESIKIIGQELIEYLRYSWKFVVMSNP
jgi:hypothetical protein